MYKPPLRKHSLLAILSLSLAIAAAFVLRPTLGYADEFSPQCAQDMNQLTADQNQLAQDQATLTSDQAAEEVAETAYENCLNNGGDCTTQRIAYQNDVARVTTDRENVNNDQQNIITDNENIQEDCASD